jgi:hypothetical protein
MAFEHIAWTITGGVDIREKTRKSKIWSYAHWLCPTTTKFCTHYLDKIMWLVHNDVLTYEVIYRNNRNVREKIKSCVGEASGDVSINQLRRLCF